MKKTILVAFALFFAMSSFPVSAAMMRSAAVIDDHTAEKEAEGKIIWERLQVREITCTALSEDQFEALGEYYMGAMMDAGHAQMNAMMEQMLGEEGEEAMHAALGKRLSGCDPLAEFPQGSAGFMPMMQLTSGKVGWTAPVGYGPMGMHFGYGFGFFGWVSMFLFWALILALLLAVLKWLKNQSKHDEPRK